jgi:hypothetical protein
MAADLHLAGRADVVGVVDHPRGEPERPALDLGEKGRRGSVGMARS